VRRGLGLWVVIGVAAAWACQHGVPGALTPTPSTRAATGSVVSNVLRADYIGSEACAGCHAEIYEAWRRTPMHRMTRDLASTEITAPFDGRSLRLGDDVATLEEHEGRRFMALSQAGSRSLFRVTKVIGGRYREDFVGEQVSPAAPLGKALDEQRVLPLSFLRFDGTLRYKGYSVMVPERHGLEAGLVWQRACILCHNTAPQFVALYDELFGAQAPSYQGSASNELPADKTFKYVIDDAEGLRAALEAELHLLGARGSLPEDPQLALRIAISNTRERFDEGALVELGVGCESCHGGARAHAAAPDRAKASFALRSPFMHVETAAGGQPTRAQDINRGCAKCHTVLFSQYPFTWEGGERRHAPGGSSTNSGEARDFLLGGCARAMSCTSCHDPHGQDAPSRLAELASVPGNVVCTKCHQTLAAPAALQQHSHHSPQGEGGVCLNCHMPKKNMGLAYDFTRYHRIGSPTDQARVLGDRPLECALCHADRSVDQIVSTMEKWWGKRYDRAALKQLYGADLRENPIRITLLAGKPHEKALAADIAVTRHVPATTDSIVALLNNEYPLVRYFARHSLERRFGTPIPLDMNLPGPELVQMCQGRDRAAGARWGRS
jgi:predicted CXXCH cytochrome family protein